MKKNNGSALISVLVGITFIMILASTLLFVTYTNYQTKMIDTNSVTNFYQTEVAVKDIDTKVRNVALNSSATDLFPDIAAAVGATDLKALEGDGHTEVWRYDVATLQSFVTTPTGSTVTVACNLDPDEANLVNDSANKRVTLKGITVTSTSANGEVNTITTDLDIFYASNSSNGGPGPMQIGDFSMITSSPVKAVTSGIDIYGYCIISKSSTSETYDVKKKSDSSTITIQPAMALLDGSYCNDLADLVIINGDLLIDDSTLSIIGNNLVVNGTIYIGGCSSIICTGKLESKNGIVELKAATEDLKYFPSNLVSTVQIDPTNTTRLQSLSSLATTDIYSELIESSIEMKYTEGGVTKTKSIPLSAGEITNLKLSNSTSNTVDGVSYAGGFLGTEVINVGLDLNHKLVISTKANPVELIGAQLDTTILSPSGIEINGRHHAILNNMTKRGYETALLSTVSGISYGGANGCTLAINDVIKDDASSKLHNWMTGAISGGGGSITYNSITGYSNWTKN